MGDYAVIGVCGNCGGEVRRITGPLLITGPWPKPTCHRCGAIPRSERPKVLDMGPSMIPQRATREAE